MHLGDHCLAVKLTEQAVPLARSVGEPSLLAWILLNLGLATEEMADPKRSEHVYREMLEMARWAREEPLVVRALDGIGNALRIRGHNARARMVLEEALSIARPRHDKWLTSVVSGSLGLALLSEDPQQALSLLEESLALSFEIGHRFITVSRLEQLAAYLAPSDHADVAAQLLGASESLRDAFGYARSGALQAEINNAGGAARERLGPAAFELAWGKGRGMTADEAVALALGRNAPARAERVQRPGGLTGREAQIVLDIARGLTNRQIAERLGISERTVDAHVQNIRNKLGMEKRAQIAAWASAHLPKAAPA